MFRSVPEELPLDDPKAYEIFCKGYTSGIFQFESLLHARYSAALSACAGSKTSRR